MLGVTTIVDLCDAGEVREGVPLRVDLPDHEPLCVYRVGDQVFVTEDTCTHGKASLSDEGEQDGFVITCTWHDGAFDIRDGSIVSRPCVKPLKTFVCEVRNGRVVLIDSETMA